MNWTFFSSIIHIFFAFLMLWKVMDYSIKGKNVKKFYPFIFLIFIYILRGIFVFFGKFVGFLWNVLNVFIFVFLIWISINTWRNK